MFDNEEDIRGKLLLPYLKDLGFDESEISLEKSFTVRLGKGKHKNSYSDILCKRNGQNLFVIELKRDGHKITKDDIDQGISYARMLDGNIAPFTIITNGSETLVYDTITRQELSGINISSQSNFWINNCTLATDEDLKIRYEALKTFVSLSPDNMKVFCTAQVKERMGTIVGDINEPYAKFIKELNIKREGLDQRFSEFINSGASFFGLVGDAGVGKTNSICSLVLQYLDSKFVLFYNAALINKSPIDHISEDLNLFFSNNYGGIKTLKKLNEIAEYANTDIVIFIDAVDENTSNGLSLELSEIALNLNSLDRVKICISCKTNVWNNFITKNGEPTHLFSELSKFHAPIADLKNSPGYLLRGFNEEELNKLIPLYKQTFNLEGEITEDLLNELKNGFFLRIFSEVYSGGQIPDKVDDEKLIKKYLSRSINKAGIESQYALRILSRIGEIFVDRDYTSWERYKDEGVDYEDLHELLNLGIGDSIAESLFNRNILIRSSADESHNISFYYSKIRDYVICYHSFKLDKMTDKEFSNILTKLFHNHIGHSAISFYVLNAKESHLEALRRFKKERAIAFIKGYNSFLDENFGKFKEKFSPYTRGDIGVLLPKKLIHNDGYALMPIDSETNSLVEFESFEDLMERDMDRFLRRGVHSVYGSNKGLMIDDHSEKIEQDIFKQLEKIVEEADLSIHMSEALMREEIAVILYYHGDKLGYDFDFRVPHYTLPKFNELYPIDLKLLRDRTNRYLVEYYFRSYQRVERDKIEDKIEQTLSSGEAIPEMHISGDFPPFQELLKVVDNLICIGYDSLNEHYLPLPDLSDEKAKELYYEDFEKAHYMTRPSQFSGERSKEYIESFYVAFEKAYKEFVEYWFPTLKSQLPFYKSIPNEYLIFSHETEIPFHGWIAKRAISDDNAKTAFLKPVSHKEMFKIEGVESYSSFVFDHLLFNSSFNRTETVKGLNTPRVDEYCILRNQIFYYLKSDIKTLIKNRKKK